MRVRIIDYVANLGGGVRFSGKLLKALTDLPCGAEFELVSHGSALERVPNFVVQLGSLWNWSI